MLAVLLAAAEGLVNTYPVSSYNLTNALATDGVPAWFNAWSSQTIGGLDDAA